MLQKSESWFLYGVYSKRQKINVGYSSENVTTAAGPARVSLATSLGLLGTGYVGPLRLALRVCHLLPVSSS